MDEQGSGLRLYVWAMGALALVAGVLVVMTWSEYAALQATAAANSKTVQGNFAALAAKVEKLASQSIDPEREAERADKSNFQQFLEKAAKDSGIPAGSVTIFSRKEDKNTRGKFIEITYRVKIARANRRQIADFCYRVEYYRDYLKVRSIKLQRDPRTTDDTWKNSMIHVAFREPMAKKKS